MYMDVYMCVYIYVCVCIYIYTCIYVCVYTADNDLWSRSRSCSHSSGSRCSPNRVNPHTNRVNPNPIGIYIYVCVWKQSLLKLSGGQRSLVALSLVLALLRFKVPVYINPYIYMYPYIYIYIWMYTCVYIYVCVYVYTYIHVYIYVYTADNALWSRSRSYSHSSGSRYSPNWVNPGLPPGLTL